MNAVKKKIFWKINDCFIIALMRGNSPETASADNVSGSVSLSHSKFFPDYSCGFIYYSNVGIHLQALY